MAARPPPAESGAEPRRGRFGRAQRLRSPVLFREAYEGGRRAVGRWMVLWARSGPDANRRLGVVSSRRIGGAVARNRARRRLREVFRRHRDRLTDSADVVLVARAGCAEAPWNELTEEFLRLARRVGIAGDAGPRGRE